MCIKNYIKGIVEECLIEHPIADHTHENYIEKKDIGYVFFGNNAEVQWNTSINGVSTSVYLDVKTIL